MPSVAQARQDFESLISSSSSLAIPQRPIIVVDFGSYECRAGFNKNPDGSAPAAPYLRFKNQVAKPKTLINKEIDQIHIVGDEFALFDSSKLHKKTIFDRNVVTHINSMEHVLDYTFSHLGINQQIENPLFFLEPIGNP